MRELLLSNLARNQSFDGALKKGEFVDQISGQYVEQILFNTDATKRAAAIKDLQRKIVVHFDKKVQPAARAIGVENAKAVLTATPPPPAGLNNEAYRKKVLYEGKIHSRDRVRIVQANINARANTLENRLTAFYLEPGMTPRQKLNTLRTLHEKMDREQKVHGQKLSAYIAGEGDRPRPPNTDFLARFNQDVKKDVRVQARRAGTDAETSHFEANGHKLLAWVTVNASEACPDCRRRQSVIGDAAFWDRTGRPGSGSTVCGASCYCMLVPSTTLDSSPELKQKGLETNPKPVSTPPTTVKALEKQPRAGDDDKPVTVIKAKPGEKGEAIPRPPKAPTSPTADDTAKALTKHFDQWRKSLTADEAAAVERYQSIGTGYKEINGYLRTGATPAKATVEQIKDTISHLDTATAKGALPVDVPVVRAFRGTDELIDRWQRHADAGMPWKDDGFASTSLGEEVAPTFFGTKNQLPVLMEFIAPAGTPAAIPTAVTGQMTEQQEVLLGRGLNFLIRSIEKDGKLTRVKAEVASE